MTPGGPSRRTELLVGLALIAGFGVLAAALHGTRDFWMDEVASLVHFTFVPLEETVTHYPYTNNHVLSNLLNNVVVRAAGVRDLHDLLGRPWLLRGVSIAFSLMTLAYLWRAARTAFGARAGLLALATLATSISFLIFAPQVRGYAMSMAFLAMLLHHGLAFSRDGGRLHAAAVVVSTALALYAIPLNLYFVAVFAGFHALTWLNGRWPPRGDGVLSRLRREWLPEGPRDGRVALLVAAGVALATLLYAPILHDLLFNEVVKPHHRLRWVTLHHDLPMTAFWFTSHRYLLLVPMIGVPAAAALGRMDIGSDRKRTIVLALAILFLPFLMSFARHGNPVYRVFVNGILAFALLGGVTADAAFARLRGRWWTGASVAYLVVMFGLNVHWSRRWLAQDIQDGVKTQHLMRAFHQGPYSPSSLARLAAQQDGIRDAPVAGYWFERLATREYLAREGIGFVRLGRRDLAAEFAEFAKGRDRFHVVSCFPNRFPAQMAADHPEFRVVRLDDGTSWMSLYRLERR